MSINEKDIIGSPKPVTVSGTLKILNQMRNCICKLKLDNTEGTGFFCSFSYGKKNTMNCLITNNHVLNEKYYDENNKITLFLNDDNIIKVIDLTKERKTYFNDEYDIALIEILDTDKIEYYLELDDVPLKKDENYIKEFYNYSSIYIIQYFGRKAHVSYGLIKGINKFEIKHLCCTQSGSSGSPLLNLENNKIIGIHKSAYQKANLNGGTLLKVLLDNIEFKTKQNINENITDEPKSIDVPHNNKGSWMYIFNQVINDFKYENKKLSEEEINEMAKDKIKEIKLLHKIFKILYGATENSKKKSSIENILYLMISVTIGTCLFKKENNNIEFTINFQEIELWIKGKIKKNLPIREQNDVKSYIEDFNGLFFRSVIDEIYNNNKETLELLVGFGIFKILRKMVIDNIFSYNTEKELNEALKKAAIEIISDLKDKNNFKNQYIVFNGKYLLSNKYYKNYQTIIDKFYKLLKKSNSKEQENKENEDLEKNLIDLLVYQWKAYLKSLGIIFPIQFQKYTGI